LQSAYKSHKVRPVREVTDIGGGGDLDNGLDINIDGASGRGMVVDGGAGSVAVFEEGVSDLELSDMLALAQVIVEAAFTAVCLLCWW